MVHATFKVSSLRAANSKVPLKHVVLHEMEGVKWGDVRLHTETVALGVSDRVPIRSNENQMMVGKIHIPPEGKQHTRRWASPAAWPPA